MTYALSSKYFNVANDRAQRHDISMILCAIKALSKMVEG